MPMLPLLLAAGLLLLPASATAAGKDAAGNEELTASEYHSGLKTLRGYLEKRGLKPDAAERFISVMARTLPPSEGRRVAVTRDVFASFLRYQAAWARKTRDGKHAAVPPDKLREEVERAARLKEEFRLKASASSPEFYRVFQAAVRDVRGTRRRDGTGYAGSSAVFFSDDVDLSYTHVDAGDVALENGDAVGAIAEAAKALAINPGNADAFVLRAGARYARGDAAAAIQDAQSALVLDPRNQQAQAILSLSGLNAGRAALAQAAASVEAHSPTPAVGALLSVDLTERAVEASESDARASINELDRALALNPRNEPARGWRTAMLNRVGEYNDALASAEQTLTSRPDDAPAYFNKAYALAGARDKAGALEALTMAARLDPAYQPALDRALQLPGPEDMEMLFGEWALSHRPAPPPSRRARFPLPLLLLGCVGGLLALAGGAVLFGKGR